MRVVDTPDWPLLFSGSANGPYQEKPALFGLMEALDDA